MRETARLFSVFLAAAFFLGPSLRAQDLPNLQNTPVLEQLAQRTTDTVTKARTQRLLATPSGDCVLDRPLCLEFVSILETAIRKAIPDAYFVNREELLRVVKVAGFVPDDADDEAALDIVSARAGVDTLLTIKLKWEKGGYRLSTRAYDVGKQKVISELKSSKVVVSSTSSFGDEPVVYTNPETGVSTVRQRNPRITWKGYPQCIKCPEPGLSVQMKRTGQVGTVVVLATINQRGLPMDVRAVKSFSLDAADYTEKAVQTWLFKPATALDGTPLAMRTLIELTYGISHN